MKKQPLSEPLTAYHWWRPLLFFVVLISGLLYVKWSPYYTKAFVAADTHSIGASVLTQISDTPLSAAIDYTQIYFLAVWKAALLGLILGSLIQVLIPRNWLLKTLGQSHFFGALFGTAFSLPGMMCSCCAAPVVVGMRRQQVSMGGALAFWIGNPLLNPATLVFMGFVLGWYFVVIRLIVGLATVLAVAYSVQKFIKEKPLQTEFMTSSPVEVQGSFFIRWGKAFWFLFCSVVPVYVLVVLILGAASVWLFPHTGIIVGNGLLLVILMAIVGCLFVIPTAAEIPIVKTMMLAGMGLAPATALLITLPAVSLPSLIMLRKVFPAKALWLTVFLVILCGVLAGIITYFINSSH